MRWFGKHRLTAAEALELELAGVATEQSVAELLPVTNLLRATASGLPSPITLRARRRELMAIGATASRDRQRTSRNRSVIRATVIALAIAAISVAGGLAATLAASLLQSPPPPISRPVQLPPGDGDRTPKPTSSTRATPGTTLSVVTPQVPPAVTAELLAKLRAACGQQAVLPDLGGLDAAAARARVDALIAACDTAPGTAQPSGQPPQVRPELGAELLAKLREACGPEAVLPDLGGLDAAAARARVDALIAACDVTPGAASVTTGP